jgi:hypothetical protein
MVLQARLDPVRTSNKYRMMDTDQRGWILQTTDFIVPWVLFVFRGRG